VSLSQSRIDVKPAVLLSKRYISSENSISEFVSGEVMVTVSNEKFSYISTSTPTGHKDCINALSVEALRHGFLVYFNMGLQQKANNAVMCGSRTRCTRIS